MARSSELSVPRPVSPDRRVGGNVAKEPRPESALRRVGGPRCDEPDDDDCDARFVGERLICDPQPVSWWPPAPWPPRLPLKWRRTGESTDTAAAVDLCGNQNFTARSSAPNNLKCGDEKMGRSRGLEPDSRSSRLVA